MMKSKRQGPRRRKITMTPPSPLFLPLFVILATSLLLHLDTTFCNAFFSKSSSSSSSSTNNNNNGRLNHHHHQPPFAAFTHHVRFSISRLVNHNTKKQHHYSFIDPNRMLLGNTDKLRTKKRRSVIMKNIFGNYDPSQPSSDDDNTNSNPSFAESNSIPNESSPSTTSPPPPPPTIASENYNQKVQHETNRTTLNNARIKIEQQLMQLLTASANGNADMDDELFATLEHMLVSTMQRLNTLEIMEEMEELKKREEEEEKRKEEEQQQQQKQQGDNPAGYSSDLFSSWPGNPNTFDNFNSGIPSDMLSSSSAATDKPSFSEDTTSTSSSSSASSVNPAWPGNPNTMDNFNAGIPGDMVSSSPSSGTTRPTTPSSVDNDAASKSASASASWPGNPNTMDNFNAGIPSDMLSSSSDRLSPFDSASASSSSTPPQPPPLRNPMESTMGPPPPRSPPQTDTTMGSQWDELIDQVLEEENKQAKEDAASLLERQQREEQQQQQQNSIFLEEKRDIPTTTAADSKSENMETASKKSDPLSSWPHRKRDSTTNQDTESTPPPPPPPPTQSENTKFGAWPGNPNTLDNFNAGIPSNMISSSSFSKSEGIASRTRSTPSSSSSMEEKKEEASQNTLNDDNKFSAPPPSMDDNVRSNPSSSWPGNPNTMDNFNAGIPGDMMSSSSSDGPAAPSSPSAWPGNSNTMDNFNAGIPGDMMSSSPSDTTRPSESMDDNGMRNPSSSSSWPGNPNTMNNFNAGIPSDMMSSSSSSSSRPSTPTTPMDSASTVPPRNPMESAMGPPKRDPATTGGGRPPQPPPIRTHNPMSRWDEIIDKVLEEEEEEQEKNEPPPPPQPPAASFEPQLMWGNTIQDNYSMGRRQQQQQQQQQGNKDSTSSSSSEAADKFESGNRGSTIPPMENDIRGASPDNVASNTKPSMDGTTMGRTFPDPYRPTTTTPSDPSDKRRITPLDEAMRGASSSSAFDPLAMDSPPPRRPVDDVWGSSTVTGMGPTRQMDKNRGPSSSQQQQQCRPMDNNRTTPDPSEKRRITPLDEAIRGASSSSSSSMGSTPPPRRPVDDVWGSSTVTGMGPTRQMDKDRGETTSDSSSSTRRTAGGLPDATAGMGSPQRPMDDIRGLSTPTGMGPSRPADNTRATTPEQRDTGSSSSRRMDDIMESMRRTRPMAGEGSSRTSSDTTSSPRQPMDNIRGKSDTFGMRTPPPPPPPPPLMGDKMGGQLSSDPRAMGPPLGGPMGMTGPGGGRKRDDLMNMVFGPNNDNIGEEIKDNGGKEEKGNFDESTLMWETGGNQNQQRKTTEAPSKPGEGAPWPSSSARPMENIAETKNVGRDLMKDSWPPRSTTEDNISSDATSMRPPSMEIPTNVNRDEMPDPLKMGPNFMNTNKDDRNTGMGTDSATMRPPSMDISQSSSRQDMPDPTQMGPNFLDTNREGKASMETSTDPSPMRPPSMDIARNINRQAMPDPTKMGPNFMNSNEGDATMDTPMDSSTMRSPSMDIPQSTNRQGMPDPTSMGSNFMNTNRHETNYNMETDPSTMGQQSTDDNDFFNRDDDENRELQWWERGADRQSSYKFMGTSPKYMGVQFEEREDEINYVEERDSSTMWSAQSIGDTMQFSNEEETKNLEGPFEPTSMWSKSPGDNSGTKQDVENNGKVETSEEGSDWSLQTNNPSEKDKVRNSLKAEISELSGKQRKGVEPPLPGSTISWSAPTDDIANPTGEKGGEMEDLNWSAATNDPFSEDRMDITGANRGLMKSKFEASNKEATRLQEDRDENDEEPETSESEERLWPLQLHHNAEDIKKVGESSNKNNEDRKWKIETPKTKLPSSEDRESNDEEKDPNINTAAELSNPETKWSDKAPGAIEERSDSFSSVGRTEEDDDDSLVMWHSLGGRKSNLDGVVMDGNAGGGVELDEEEENSGLSFHFRMKKMMDKYVNDIHKGDGSTDSRA